MPSSAVKKTPTRTVSEKTPLIVAAKAAPKGAAMRAPSKKTTKPSQELPRIGTSSKAKALLAQTVSRRTRTTEVPLIEPPKKDKKKEAPVKILKTVKAVKPATPSKGVAEKVKPGAAIKKMPVKTTAKAATTVSKGATSKTSPVKKSIAKPVVDCSNQVAGSTKKAGAKKAVTSTAKVVKKTVEGKVHTAETQSDFSNMKERYQIAEQEDSFSLRRFAETIVDGLAVNLGMEKQLLQWLLADREKLTPTRLAHIDHFMRAAKLSPETVLDAHGQTPKMIAAGHKHRGLMELLEHMY